MKNSKHQGHSQKRLIALCSPNGTMTILPAGSSLIEDYIRYRGFQVVLKINRPWTPERSGSIKDWILYQFRHQ